MNCELIQSPFSEINVAVFKLLGMPFSVQLTWVVTCLSVGLQALLGFKFVKLHHLTIVRDAVLPEGSLERSAGSIVKGTGEGGFGISKPGSSKGRLRSLSISFSAIFVAIDCKFDLRR